MQDIRYIISDASKKIGVEQYTLRYWEEELNLDIQRNEMGHRYYREEDLEVFRAVKILKEQGYQLRAIKMLLPDILQLSNKDDVDMTKLHKELDKKYIDSMNSGESPELDELPIPSNLMNESQDIFINQTVGKIDQFKAIMSDLIAGALEDNNERMAITVSDNVTNSVIKEMDYLLRIKEEREEERFKQFDRLLREMQSSRSEAAATKVFKNKKKKLLFSNKR